MIDTGILTTAWAFTEPGICHIETCPAIYDLNGDGNVEVIFGTACLMSNYANATITPGWPNPQIIADLYDNLHVVFLNCNEHRVKYLMYHIEVNIIKQKDTVTPIYNIEEVGKYDIRETFYELGSIVQMR